MERDEERWKKFKEDQWKRLRDIEQQNVAEMTDLEILAGKRRIKLQAVYLRSFMLKTRRKCDLQTNLRFLRNKVRSLRD
ncbi:uncharacterized protein LOC108192688 isoform X2 [Daucus carota subsp. sativus]|uniref:uncharacterized protein LOC108192688 isoform X2 n=1 Tax=Daucus carota subsp. sativus TaxID=79200 RepID=UPI003082EC40